MKKSVQTKSSTHTTSYITSTLKKTLQLKRNIHRTNKLEPTANPFKDISEDHLEKTELYTWIPIILILSRFKRVVFQLVGTSTNALCCDLGDRRHPSKFRLPLGYCPGDEKVAHSSFHRPKIASKQFIPLVRSKEL